jgi:hypothetical protein
VGFAVAETSSPGLALQTERGRCSGEPVYPLLAVQPMTKQPSPVVVDAPGSKTSGPVPFPVVVLLLFVSSALRFPGVLLDNTLWAEDCLFFFRQSVEMGPSAILSPVYGSHHTLPRLVALLISFFPTYWAPFLFTVAAGLLASVSLSLFSRAGYRWLVPDDRLRVLVCWLFSLAPGTKESYFAISPGTYAVFCALFLLLLERDAQGRWKMGIGRTLLVSFLWYSLGQGLVLAPLIAYLFWLTRNRNYLFLLMALAGAVLLNVTTENVYRPDPLPAPGLLASIYFENLAVRLAFLSVVPYSAHDFVRKLATVPFVLLSVALIGGYLWAAFRARRRDVEGARVLVLTVLCIMATFPLTALVRDYGVTALTRAQVTLGGRAALVPAVLALILLWQLLAHESKDRSRVVALVVLWVVATSLLFALMRHHGVTALTRVQVALGGRAGLVAAVLALFFLWQLLARPGKEGLRRATTIGLLAWTTHCILHEPLFQRPRPPLESEREWPAQAATIDAALRARRAGTLQKPVVLSDIRCRPAYSKWTIRGLMIAPDGKPSPSGPPPPRR